MPTIGSRDGMGAWKIDETGVTDEDYLLKYISANPDALQQATSRAACN